MGAAERSSSFYGSRLNRAARSGLGRLRYANGGRFSLVAIVFVLGWIIGYETFLTTGWSRFFFG